MRFSVHQKLNEQICSSTLLRFIIQDLRNRGTKIFAVAIGDDALMDMHQIRRLVDSPADVLELSKFRNAEDLADKLLDILCE